MHRTLARALACAALGALLLAPTASAGQAQRPHVTTFRMTLDCASTPTTRQAIAYMSAHDLCGYGHAAGPSPYNTVYGDCGSLSVYTFNSGSGNMQWKGEITSSLGPFIAAGYSGSWLNNTRGNGGGVGRSFVGLTSDWLDIFLIYTRSGTVYSVISSAWDRLWWGGLCTSAGSPWSYANVT